MIKMLSETKDKEGKPLFDASEINAVLFNCRDTIEQHPDRIAAVLNNPEEIDMISSWKNRGAGLWRAVSEPLNSTIERNPEAFAKSVDGEKTVYNAEDIELLMKQMDIYLLKPEEVENSDILKASNPNYEQTHRQLFEEHVQLCSKIIKDYGEGRINVTPDAIAPI